MLSQLDQYREATTVLNYLLVIASSVSHQDVTLRLAYDTKTKEHYLFVRNKSFEQIYVYTRYDGYVIEFLDKNQRKVNPRVLWYGSWPEPTVAEWSLGTYLDEIAINLRVSMFALTDVKYVRIRPKTSVLRDLTALIPEGRSFLTDFKPQLFAIGTRREKGIR